MNEQGCRGRLWGIGVGPGDPELITIKALNALRVARVVAYPSAKHGRSNARAIVAAYLREDQIELPLVYPVTTEATDHPAGYDAALRAFYDECAQRIAAHLDVGRDVAVLCEGDPFFYGSYMYLHDRLAHRYQTEVIPGVPSVMGAAARLGTPVVRRESGLTILSGTLSEDELYERLRDGGAYAIMKLGRSFAKVRRAVQRAGLAHRAKYIERATMPHERIVDFNDVDPAAVPYFALVLIPAEDRAALPGAANGKGSLCVVGLGPGAAEWISPEAREALAQATDLIGYQPYLERVPPIAGQRRYGSDNRVEMERASDALRLAQGGKRVCVVSSGDPGIFAMAAAVLEAIEEGPASWRSLDVRVIPGISAMQAAAARAGAPLGHDFCVISLSDRLKPWEAIAARLDAAARVDFALALYNPLSSQRQWQFAEACAIIARHRDPQTPVLIARDVGGSGERIAVTDLANLKASDVDMRTVVIVGSSRTRTVARPGGGCFMYTPRSYGGS